jgi:hypothetical protein
VNGARLHDLATQTARAAGRNTTYATVIRGGHDVCRDTIADLPTDAEFEANSRSGMATLLTQLPSTATLQVVGVPNIKRLYDIGRDKTALGIVDGHTLTPSRPRCPDSPNTRNRQLPILDRRIGAANSCCLLLCASYPCRVQLFEASAGYYTEHPTCHIQFGYTAALSHLVYRGADVLFVPSRFEPCGLTQLPALRYNPIAIVRPIARLADTVGRCRPIPTGRCTSPMAMRFRIAAIPAPNRPLAARSAVSIPTPITFPPTDAERDTLGFLMQDSRAELRQGSKHIRSNQPAAGGGRPRPPLTDTGSSHTQTHA